VGGGGGWGAYRALFDQLLSKLDGALAEVARAAVLLHLPQPNIRVKPHKTTESAESCGLMRLILDSADFCRSPKSALNRTFRQAILKY
jgi:hypothetical protein